MARGINKVILVGNLGDDPEVRYTQAGAAITSIKIATTTARKDKNGELQEKTEWHRVKFFGKLGEIAGEYLRKGSQVYVEGSIRYTKHTGDDGVDRYYTDIVCDEMQMLGGKKDDGDRSQATQRQGRNPNAGSSRSPMARAPEPESMNDFNDDDIPF